MKVSKHLEDVFASKGYKYQTKINMIRCLKAMGLYDMDVKEVTVSVVTDRLETYINQNVKRVYSGYCRNIFGFTFSQLPVVEGQSRIYDLPSQEVLHSVIDRSKYSHYLYLCMYAGLRIGEACAVTPQQVKKEGDNYWLIVDRAWTQDGSRLTSPKTIGKVLIPSWLALEILSFKNEWKKGRPTKLITTACLSLGRVEKVKINPHMLRHWFATDMIKRNVNPEVARRQLRHKSPLTTLKVYTQVNSAEIASSLPTLPVRPTSPTDPTDNVINLPIAN